MLLDSITTESWRSKRSLLGRTVSEPLTSRTLHPKPPMQTTLTSRPLTRHLWKLFTDAVIEGDTIRADFLRAEISRAEREELDQAEC